ncbi:MAG: hypothetical protein ACK521_03925 [bacterium]
MINTDQNFGTATVEIYVSFQFWEYTAHLTEYINVTFLHICRETQITSSQTLQNVYFNYASIEIFVSFQPF